MRHLVTAVRVISAITCGLWLGLSCGAAVNQIFFFIPTL